MVAIITHFVYDNSGTADANVAHLLNNMETTNSILVDHTVTHTDNGIRSTETFTFHAYRGYVLKVNSHYNSSMDMEWTTATVAIYDENGNFSVIETGCDSAAVDASDAIKADYAAYLARKQRVFYIQKKLNERSSYRNAAKKANLGSMFVAKDLEKACGMYYPDVIKLLTSHANNRLRSGFRKSLAEQVMNWVTGERKYGRPLSPKQFASLNTERTYY